MGLPVPLARRLPTQCPLVSHTSTDSDSRADGAPRARSRPLADFIEPCLPRLADKPPAGPDWLHEIKHDGFRIMAERDGDRVRLLSRKGHDFASRFPLAAAAVAALSARSCIIDGEAIACDEKGLAVFDLIRRQQHGRAVALCAFDLLEARRRGFAAHADLKRAN
jgi:ATP-dependent DNA ligase